MTPSCRRAARRATSWRGAAPAATLPLYYIGPDRDLPMIEGLNIRRTESPTPRWRWPSAWCDDMTETIADYAERAGGDARRRGLTMLCANPDLVVHRGTRLVYCAGSLAQAYEKLGGEVIYYGKPHLPVYRRPALAQAAEPPQQSPSGPWRWATGW